MDNLSLVCRDFPDEEPRHLSAWVVLFSNLSPLPNDRIFASDVSLTDVNLIGHRWEDSQTYKCFLRLHSLLRSGNASDDKGSNNSSSTSKRSRAQFEASVRLAGIKKPDWSWKVYGPPTGTSTSSMLTRQQGVEAVHDDKKQDTKLYIRRFLPKRVFRHLPKSKLDGSRDISHVTSDAPFNVFTPDHTPTDTSNNPRMSIPNQSRTCLIAAVGEIKSFKYPLVDLLPTLKPRIPSTSTQTQTPKSSSYDPDRSPQAMQNIRALIARGWGQCFMYLVQSAEVSGTWLGCFAFQSSFSRCVMLDINKRLIGVELPIEHASCPSNPDQPIVISMSDFFDHPDLIHSLTWHVDHHRGSGGKGARTKEQDLAREAFYKWHHSIYKIIGKIRSDKPMEKLVHPSFSLGQSHPQDSPSASVPIAWKERLDSLAFLPVQATSDREMMRAAVAARDELKKVWETQYPASDSNTPPALSDDKSQEETEVLLDEFDSSGIEKKKKRRKDDEGEPSNGVGRTDDDEPGPSSGNGNGDGDGGNGASGGDDDTTGNGDDDVGDQDDSTERDNQTGRANINQHESSSSTGTLSDQTTKTLTNSSNPSPPHKLKQPSAHIPIPIASTSRPQDLNPKTSPTDRIHRQFQFQLQPPPLSWSVPTEDSWSIRTPPSPKHAHEHVHVRISHSPESAITSPRDSSDGEKQVNQTDRPASQVRSVDDRQEGCFERQSEHVPSLDMSSQGKVVDQDIDLHHHSPTQLDIDLGDEDGEWDELIDDEEMRLSEVIIAVLGNMNWSVVPLTKEVMDQLIEEGSE
ncbi:hypothetical protein M231_08071 [Tremella mesenterica]|uniref:Uncharacterized protein n=1 Tax=Tremella mesenterica TaxID=5217 RepID=A0A4Q1BFG4_TREME|nr:hypothetical protein M231_08071 [Tremella mesenterica]